MITRESALLHFGIPGMRWGRRKSPAELAAKYIKKQKKAGIQNDKLEKKLVKNDIRIARNKSRVRVAQEEFNKASVRAMTSGLSTWQVRKLKRAAKHLKYANQNEARATWDSARYKKRIYKNKQLVKKLDQKLSDIDPKEVARGRALVEEAFK